ncbi:unnamed protein product [Peniophora sp. CBMAI 1063]|nr:unnamed protein product [Peniophora sp. CBMAI 1063]
MTFNTSDSLEHAHTQPDTDLGDKLMVKYKRDANPQDLDEAIAAYRRILELIPDEDYSSKLVQLNSLGVALYTRFERSGDPDDLDSVISAGYKSVELSPKGHENEHLQSGNLGSTLWVRFRRFGNTADLESALIAKRRAVDLTPDGHPAKTRWLTNLGTSLHDRFNRFGEAKDIEEAIAVQRRVIELTPDDSANMPDSFISLGLFSQSRFKRYGDTADLETAAVSMRRAVELAPEGHHDKARLLGHLGAILWSRFERFGDRADIEEAIEAKRRAVDLTPDGGSNKPRWLTNLGTSLLSRFEHYDDVADLESALRVQRRAVELTPHDHPDLSFRLANLGVAYRSRFVRFGDSADLDLALEAERRAVDLTPDGHPNKPHWLTNLGVLFHERYKLRKDVADLQSALDAKHRAVELTPEQHTLMPMRLSNLGVSLIDRFLIAGDPADIENCVGVMRRAVQLTSDGHPSKSRWLGTLASALCLRFEHLGRAADLDDAIATGRRAVELIQEGNPGLPRELKQLGEILYAHFKRERSQQNFTTAIDCLMRASKDRLGALYDRFRATEFVIMLLTRHPELSTPEVTLQAHARMVDVLPEIVWLGHDMQRRFQESARAGRLIYAAVSAAIEAGALRQAVEWMEAGRSLVWSQVIAIRSPVEELQERQPDLAQAFHAVQLDIQRAERDDASLHLQGSSDTLKDTAGSDMLNRHRQLVVKYERLLDEIRRCPGFEAFLRPPRFQDLTAALGPNQGPIVYLNTTSTRGDALIVDGGSVERVALPGLNEERATELRKRWWGCLQESDVRVRGMAPKGRIQRGTKAILQLVLKRLWTWIVHPVLQRLFFLNEARRADLPHITWCPTGSLMQLPLHAAGIYSFSTSSGLRESHAFDFVVSSYTPSLTALARCLRKSDEAHHSAPKLLVVTQPETPKQAPLPHTLDEATKLRALLPKEQRTFLNHDQATLSSVLPAISQHAWVHLACHGSQNAKDPTLSAFELYDGPLTLGALMSTASDDAELAFLSACQTATGNERIPEESMHLAAGMLAVGMKGVIATMWSIKDEDAPVVVETYYRKLIELRDSGSYGRVSTGAAYALHEATKRLREEVGDNAFERWVPFVHFGA